MWLSSHWLTVAMVAPAFLGLLWWSWGRVGDVVLDWGREAYVPWQLSEGQVLYRDLSYFNGPLSPYWNSLVFRLAGPGITHLVLSNAVMLALLLGLVYALLRALSSPLVALVGSLWIVLVLECGHYVPYGNYNFLAPYSHEITHGLVASLAALYCFWRYLQRGTLVPAMWSGLFAGLVFLTKPEIFLALAAGLGVGLGLAVWNQPNLKQRLRLVGAFLGAALVPPVAGWLLLAMAMPLGDAFRGTLGGFAFLTNRELTSQPFYQTTMGTSALRDSFTISGVWVFFYLIVALGASILAPRRDSAKDLTLLSAGAALAVTAAAAWWFYPSLVSQAMFPLPYIVLAAIGLLVYRMRRGGASDSQRARDIARLTFSVFALALLLKIVFWVHPALYGFALALPATLVLFMLFLDWLPSAMERRGISGLVLQAALLGPIAVFAGASLSIDQQFFAAKTEAVGVGADRIMTYPESANAANETLNTLSTVDPRATLLVMPEGVMLNYLSRRASPTPYYNFLPPELLMFGEDAMLTALTAHPADILAWVPRDTSEYGFARLGNGYGEKLTQWRDKNYGLAQPVSPDKRSRILLLVRKRGP